MKIFQQQKSRKFSGTRCRNFQRPSLAKKCYLTFFTLSPKAGSVAMAKKKRLIFFNWSTPASLYDVCNRNVWRVVCVCAYVFTSKSTLVTAHSLALADRLWPQPRRSSSERTPDLKGLGLAPGLEAAALSVLSVHLPFFWSLFTPSVCKFI